MPEEKTFKNEDEYTKHKQSKIGLANEWDLKIQAADRVYKSWAERFNVSRLYQAYEGFQWLEEVAEADRPYVVNMIYSTIETKLPNLLFNNPQFVLRPRPSGETFDLETASRESQTKEDALNYVCAREEFGLNDKHELAALDAFFGFGVLEIDYSRDPVTNPYLCKGSENPLDKLYCKHIPFDQFRVSALANWDLSKGKWLGYYDFIPSELLQKYAAKNDLTIEMKSYPEEELNSVLTDMNTGKIVLGETSDVTVPPSGTSKIWYIWDLEKGKNLQYCPDDAKGMNRILIYKDFEYCPLVTLRYGKRRKGWYPLPPVFNWISPQAEINDIKQTLRIHRKRFSRKYAILEGSVEEEEQSKFENGPDGTSFFVKKENAIKAVEDPIMDTANQVSLIGSFDDMNRVSGTASEARGLADRTTASQAVIMDKRSQIRESKDLLRIAGFLTKVGRNVLRALSKVDGKFWAKISLQNEGIMTKLQTVTSGWKLIPSELFAGENYDVNINLTSISPIYAQEDKKNFLEFLAIITQYEILSFSPALLREAAYRCGYKNERVLQQFQEMAQLASIGRLAQAKAQATQGEAILQQVAPGGPNIGEPGELAQRQVDTSTPPDNQELMNQIFNRGGLQQ